MTGRRKIIEPLDLYYPTERPIDTKQFAARVYGLTSIEVTWQHRDPITYWLRREFPKQDPSDRSVWYLTPDIQVLAHRYIKRASRR